jgi:hypothetical protein
MHGFFTRPTSWFTNNKAQTINVILDKNNGNKIKGNIEEERKYIEFPE